MDLRFFCIVLGSVVTARNVKNELGEHLQRLVRSEDVDGYSLATLHALDTATGQLTGFCCTPHIASKAYMGKDKYFLIAFWMGSVTTAKRAYELHALPDVTDKRSDDDMKVLVTWEDTSYALKRQTDGEYYGNDGIEIPEEVLESDSAEDEEDGDVRRRSRADRKATIEIADVLDAYYINDLKTIRNIESTEDIANLVFNKWNAAAYVLSDVDWITWNITLKLVALEIWRTNPDWYTTNENHTLIDRMRLVCRNSGMNSKYDQITVHTGKPIRRKGREVGMAWIPGVCLKYAKCSAVRSLKNGLGAELHELGHGLGLHHESSHRVCVESTEDPLRGFMGGNQTHFRRCYRHVLDYNFKKNHKACLFKDTNTDTLNWNFYKDRS